MFSMVRVKIEHESNFCMSTLRWDDKVSVPKKSRNGRRISLNTEHLYSHVVEYLSIHVSITKPLKRNSQQKSSIFLHCDMFEKCPSNRVEPKEQSDVVHTVWLYTYISQ